MTNVNCVRKVLKRRDRPRGVGRARLLTDTFLARQRFFSVPKRHHRRHTRRTSSHCEQRICSDCPFNDFSDCTGRCQVRLRGGQTTVCCCLRRGQAAEDAADAAAAKLPEANNALKRAEAAVADAVAAQGPAEKARADALAVQADAEKERTPMPRRQSKAAQDAVAKQQAQVTRAQERIDAVKSQIALLARQSYISGSESVELGILMQSQDPAQFADQLQAMARISRGNSTVFKQMTALRAELAAQLVQLNTMKQAAAGREDVAQEKAAGSRVARLRCSGQSRRNQALANKAQAARDGAANAQAAIVALVDQRKQEVARALALRRQIKATYERLQTKLTKAQGVANTHGTRRDAGGGARVGHEVRRVGASYWRALSGIR